MPPVRRHAPPPRPREAPRAAPRPHAAPPPRPKALEAPKPRPAPQRRPGAARHAPDRKAGGKRPGPPRRPQRPQGKPRAHPASVRALGTFEATAYGPPWDAMQGTGRTATGIDLRPARHAYIIAVDPSVIPLHTKVYVRPNPFGDDNIVFSAEDTGGAIKGHHIDVYDWRGRSHQLEWGIRQVQVSEVAGSVISGIPGVGGVLGGGAVGGAPSAPPPKPKYVNPLARAKVTPERIDQGVDYAGTGQLLAIARANISAVIPNGWAPFGNYIEYKITEPGELEGAYVYYAEGVTPRVRYGQHVEAGDVIADLIPGWHSGIEIGFAAGDGHAHTYFDYHDGPYSAYDGQNAATRPGIAFSNLIERLGGPPGRIEGPVVGKFPEYMPSGTPSPGVTRSAPSLTSTLPGVGVIATGQFQWPARILSAFVQLQRGAQDGAHHSHAAWFYARGIKYLTQSGR